MESRLPTPKFGLPKIISSIAPTQKMGPINKTGQDETSSTAKPGPLHKAKSTYNINAKSGNENKSPPKMHIIRSKTLATINRPTASNASHSKPVKRLGAPLGQGEAKKMSTRPTVRPRVLQRTDSNGTSTVANRPAQTTTAKRPAAPAITTAAPKPSKWDLKGRLAHASDELSSLKQKFKDITSENIQLQEQINALKNSEETYRNKAQKYEDTNKALGHELEELKTKFDSIQEKQDTLEKLYNHATKELEQYKERCNLQTSELESLRPMVENLQKDLDNRKKKNEALTTMKEELQSLVHRLDMDRRVLHNNIQELKGNIRVFCRVRPRTPAEGSKPICAINFIDECTVEVGKSDGSDAVSCTGKFRGVRQEFSFDKVFPPNTSQEDIFKELSLLVQSALEGYNVCVFAYGQTGSGKTYTMEGMPGMETEGMIPRTVRHIFHEMKQFQMIGWEYKIEASFLEIYNEHIVDLLDPQPKTYEIRMADSKGHDLYVTNLTIQEIESPEELQDCLAQAQRNRAVAATHSNERSSRSHSVTRIRLVGTHLNKGEISIGNLNLVDLAGSERLKGEESARLAETKNINKSLANLGNVILALLKKQEHIPYRNSKLTHLLMPSLGGNSKTLMLLNISPLDECYNETLNSLRFASNVNSCKTGNIKRTRTVLQNVA